VPRRGSNVYVHCSQIRGQKDGYRPVEVEHYPTGGCRGSLPCYASVIAFRLKENKIIRNPLEDKHKPGNQRKGGNKKMVVDPRFFRRGYD